MSLSSSNMADRSSEADVSLYALVPKTIMYSLVPMKFITAREE